MYENDNMLHVSQCQVLATPDYHNGDVFALCQYSEHANNLEKLFDCGSRLRVVH